MRNWQPEDWVRFILAIAVSYFICTYITGMFLRNQPTNDQNKELRLAIVILLTTIVNSLLNKHKP